jgi:hypothetical protein
MSMIYRVRFNNPGKPTSLAQNTLVFGSNPLFLARLGETKGQRLKIYNKTCTFIFLF